MSRLEIAREQLDCLGYAILARVLPIGEVDELADELYTRLERSKDPSVLRSRGRVYGSRNLMETLPELDELLQNSLLRELALSVLGRGAGLVRALYFDKPPDRSWSLPWHKDRTIAVEKHRTESSAFRNPTIKAGIPHVEAPDSLLTRMLTFRLHLDAMTEYNGPLCVIPGSHRPATDEAFPAVQLRAERGDVLAMRPLLSHSSIKSAEGVSSHRRVIHLELAPSDELPLGYRWHNFRLIR